MAASLLAFGGVYAWVAWPLAGACLLLGLLCRPRPNADPDTRTINIGLLVALCGLAFQLLPLPYSLTTTLSPNLPRFLEAYLVGFGETAAAEPGFLSLSLDPPWTVYSLAQTFAAILVFWSACRVCAEGGTRQTVRWIAWTGLAVALLAIAQRATSPHLVYWWWKPEQPTAEPFGPFVNRNHYATWIVMAVPLTLGYLLARIEGRQEDWRPRHRLSRLTRLVDSRTVWLTTAAAIMTLSLAMSSSRSGLVAFTVSLIGAAVLTRRRIPRRLRLPLVGFGTLVLLMIAAWANVNAILDRVEQTFAEGGAPGRTAIWGDTLSLIRDFWLTGTGAGTYQTAMLVYQEALRSVVYFNHAHNQYLHVAAEGGLLLTIPMAIVAAALARLASTRVRMDTSGMFWIRAGATTAVAAVALQSLWETGLRMPANAILLAVVAAVAIHRPCEAAAPPLPRAAEQSPGAAE